MAIDGKKPGDGRRMPNRGPAKFGKPAGGGRFTKPAGAPKPFQKAEGGERKFGKPAPGAYAKPGDGAPRSFNKPDGERKPFNQQGGERKQFARPSSPRPDGAPRSFNKPDGERKQFARPTSPRPSSPRPGGAPRPFHKPAPRPAAPVPAPNLGATAARKVALRVLEDVLNQDAYASLSLDEKLMESDLPQIDKRLAASIVYRTLENLTRLDFALDSFIERPDDLPPKLRNILRVGACQILLMDRIPPHAAVDESVKLTRLMGLDGFAGLVNGALRRLSEGKENIPYPKESEDGARYLSVFYSLPQWIAEELIAGYGYEEAKAIASFRTEKHFMVLRANAIKTTPAQMEEILGRKVWESAPGLLPGTFHVSGVSSLSKDKDFKEGRFTVQGEGSALSALAVGARTGMKALDACAAPGGKTAVLAEKMQNTGRILAWDVHEHRVNLLKITLQRLGVENARPAVRDAAVFREDMEDTLDAVLIDAPCTGLGVMDGKPDVKYRVTRESLDELCVIQANILDACCKYVKKGGTLVYSTCSILKRENAQQVSAFLERHPEFVRDDFPADFPEAFRGEDGQIQLLPHVNGTEGFFIARMKRA